MLWIIWYAFTFAVVCAALLFIPIILYKQSQCVNIQVVNKKGEPIAGVQILGVFEETAYATTVAGGYSSDTVYIRSAINSSTCQNYLGETDQNGLFTTRIWLGKYWGLKVQNGEESVSVLLERFSNQQYFSAQPKRLVLDPNRSLLDARWVSGE